MSRISRVTQKIFAGSATNNGVFGSAQDGTKVLTQNLATLMSKAAWDQGWLSAVMGASKFPPLEEDQALHYIETTQIAYLLSQGIPEWDAGTTYYHYQVCLNPNTFQLYGSLVDNNLNNSLSDPTKWLLLYDFSLTRKRLSGNSDYYVATTGNDSNAGTNSAPWLTIQHAIDYISNNIDFNGNSVTIHVADGTYTAGGSFVSPIVGNGALRIVGNTGTPANVLINTTSADCFAILNNATVYIDGGFKLQQNTNGNGINASRGGYAVIGGPMIYGACPTASAHLAATYNGQIDVNSNYTIAGNAPAHCSMNVYGAIAMQPGITVTLTGTPDFSTSFAQGYGNSYLLASGITFSGSGTGSRYSVNENSVIHTNGAGATYLPGNSGGTSATGGQYT